MTEDFTSSKLRHFRRTAHVIVKRASVPVSTDNFTVTTQSETVDISDLRIRFEVKHTLKKHPNTCDIRISNLNKASRGALEQKPLMIYLEAGYDGVNRLLFQGDAHFVMSKQEGSDWSTLLQIGDGDRTFVSSRVNRSYNAGANVKNVIRDVAKSMGLTLPSNIEISPLLDAQFTTGIIVHGTARDELTRLLAPYGYNWSIQHGRLQILQDEEVRADAPIIISEDTGMIGTPEFGSPTHTGKNPHMTVKMLLYPEIQPGRQVTIRSRDVNGVFRVESVTHQGDTHGEDWFTEIEVKPIAADASTGKPNTALGEALFGLSVSQIIADGAMLRLKSGNWW